MGKKYKLSSILADINYQKVYCEQYQKTLTDELANARVKTLDQNPCNDGNYFTNITLKSSINQTITDPYILKRDYSSYVSFSVQKNKSDFMGLFKQLNCLEKACLIHYDIDKNQIDVSYLPTDLYLICMQLKKHHYEPNTIVAQFNPSSTSLFSFAIKYSCLNDQYKQYKNSNIKHVYYAIGKFKSQKLILQNQNLAALLQDYFKDHTIFNFSYSNSFSTIKYINQKQKTSKQKNINEDIGGNKYVAILNDVTDYNEKAKGNPSNYYVFDLGLFVEKSLNLVKTKDKNLIFNDYSLSKNRRSVLDAKLQLYKKLTGDQSFETYQDLAQKYKDYKSLLNNKQLYDSLKSDKNVNNVIKGYKNVEFIFKYNDGVQADCIKTYFSSTDLPGVFKQLQTPSKKYIDQNAKKIFQSSFQDYPHYRISSNQDVGDFTEKNLILNDKYKFIIPIKKASSIPNNIIKQSFYYDNQKDVQMCLIQIQTDVKNIVQKKRNRFGAFSFQKTYETNGSYNLLTNEKQYKIQQNVFKNQVNKIYFKQNQLFKYIVFSQCDFKIFAYPNQQLSTKKTWNVKTSTIKKPCEDALESCKNQYDGMITRLCIDTIDYDPWEKLIQQLDKLYSKYQKIIPDKDGYIEVSPQQADIQAKNNQICKKCGKSINECTCDKQQIKLCDKIYPLDFFGLTTKLGLDSSMFGCFSATQYILNLQEQKITYQQFGSILESITKDLNLQISDITYDQLKNLEVTQSQKQMANILTQISSNEFNEAKNIYIKNQPTKVSNYFIKKVQVGIADGYAYIPVGRMIFFQYSLKNPTLLKIKGCNQIQTLKCYSMLNLVGQNYIDTISDIISGEFKDCEEAQKFLLYPYKPSIQSLFGNNQNDVSQDVGKYQFKYFYIPDSQSLSKLILNVGNSYNTPQQIKFDIYYKAPIQCGFPKDQNKPCNTMCSDCQNGKCGLQDLFKAPLVLKSSKFDATKELMELKSKTLSMAIKQAWDTCVKNVQNIMQSLQNPQQLLEKASKAKDTALQMLYQFGKNMAPIMNLFPLKCLVDAANDGRNAICSASRQAKENESVIDSTSTSFYHTIDTAKIVMQQAAQNVGNRLSNICSQIGKPLDAGAQAMKQLYKSFTIYQLCPRRFNDYISDAGVPKAFSQGLKGIMSINIANILKQILGSCLVDGIIDSVLGDVDGLIDAQKSQIKKILQTGDSQAISNLGTRFPQLAEAFGKNSSGISLQNLMSQSTINTDFMQSFYNQLMKKMNPVSLVNNTVDTLTKPETLISFAKKGTKSLVTGGVSGFTDTLMKEFKGTGASQIQKQLQTNLANLTASQKSEIVKANQLITTQQFIKQKQAFYETIMNSKS